MHLGEFSTCFLSSLPFMSFLQSFSLGFGGTPLQSTSSVFCSTQIPVISPPHFLNLIIIFTSRNIFLILRLFPFHDCLFSRGCVLSNLTKKINENLFFSTLFLSGVFFPSNYVWREIFALISPGSPFLLVYWILSIFQVNFAVFSFLQEWWFW